MAVVEHAGASGAIRTYQVKRGDTVSEIIEDYFQHIPGSTYKQKENYIVKTNGLKDANTLYADSPLIINDGGKSSKPVVATPETKPFDILYFGLLADTADGRDVGVTWEEYNNLNDRNGNKTAGYTVRWKQYRESLKKWVGKDEDVSNPESMYCYSEFKAEKDATKVQVQVRPYYGNKKYWSYVEWSKARTYDFADNAPLKPTTAPTVSIDDLTLTVSMNNIDPEDVDATYVKFNIVENDKSSIRTKEKVAISTVSHSVSWQYDDLEYGCNYKVRYCLVSSKGRESAWSPFSDNKGTRPYSPTIRNYRVNKQSDGSLRVYLAWDKVESADEYIVEYTTGETDFDLAPDKIQSTQPTTKTEIEIVDIEPGKTYFFRVKATRKDGGESHPSGSIAIAVGSPPEAPTTSSSSKSAFAGEPMELNWVHNTSDGSEQTAADLALKIGDNDWVMFAFINETNSTDGEEKVVTSFTYGNAISYKGQLHVELNTSHPALKNTKILWKVRTAGITGEVGNDRWSIERTIHIYETPTFALSVTNDISGGSAIQTLTSFPFYVRAEVKTDIEDYDIQHPIGYHLQVIANDSYTTADDAGRIKTISSGDAVYSKYFDTEEILIVELSAANIDLEPRMRYTVRCSVNMSTGLTIEQTHEFDVRWVDAGYYINATVDIDEAAYTALITPYCEDENGDLVDNISISIYRREYNGELTKIASDVPNNGRAVTDRHPALDYARYRLIAKDDITGAMSFYDMPGQKIGCTSVIIQWDESWSLFETTDVVSVEEPSYSGSILVLPYNVKITDSRKRDTARVAYAGREYPVAYYGTMIDEGSTWNTTIPKTDLDTIYALRRLSLWTGPVYVREPSGMGFWAIVTPSFNIDYDSVTIPVTLDVARVEGGA